MKVIFLDYDGVLNSPYYLIQRNIKDYKDGTIRQHWKDDFDTKRVVILREICEETGAVVVVTSSWRANEEAREYLKSKGIPIVGVTEHTVSGHRGREIAMWMRGKDIDNYVILDDEVSDYEGRQMEHVICTREGFSVDLIQNSDYYIGLQRKHIKWAKAMLEG